MRFTRQSIAAAATIVALGVLAAVALASGGGEPTTTAPAGTAETDPSPQVRTEVVRRTVHRNAGAQASTSSSDDDGTLDQGPGDRPRIPLTPVQSATATGHDVGDDHGRHHGRDDDNGDDDDHDNSGPGSSSSGHGGGGDDNSSGHGGGDHDSSGHGGDSSGHGGGDD